MLLGYTESLRFIIIAVFFTGALYLDGEKGLAKIDDGIPSGKTFTYLWNITRNFAPADDDDNCVPFGYHSHVASMNDIEAGLVGILLVCRLGKDSLLSISMVNKTILN